MTEDHSPVPRPPKVRSSQPGPSLTDHERVYGFKSRAFYRYMRKPRGLEASRIILDELAESSHPILLIAAGSLAVSCALRYEHRKDQDPEESFNKRTPYLQEAKNYWLRALEIFPGYTRMQKDDERKYDLVQMQFQTMHRLAYLPMTRTAAALDARYPLLPSESAENQRQTVSKLGHIAEAILLMHGRRPLLRVHERAGIMSEIACGMVGMVDDPAKYIILPSSFRQDNHRLEEWRADLTAIGTEESAWPRYRTAIQVKSRGVGDQVLERKRVLVDASLDLVLRPGERPAQTVSSFLEMTQGHATEEVELRFAALGRVMTQRLDLFRSSPLDSRMY